MFKVIYTSAEVVTFILKQSLLFLLQYVRFLLK